jgi:hypothetical protein
MGRQPMRSRAFERKAAGKHAVPRVARASVRQSAAQSLLDLQGTAGNQAVVRALSRSRLRSPAPVVSGPLLQREDWDFTPADYAALVKKKQDLRFEADSAWFPKPFQENLCKTLKFALTSTKPARTAGINIDDFFHGHVLVPAKAKKTDGLRKKATELEKKRDELEGKALGGKSYDPVTEQNIGAYTKAMQQTEKLATPILEDALKIEGAAVIYHTFEYSGPQINRGSPIRNILTPIGGTPAGYDPSGTEKSASQYGEMYDDILQFAFLVDEKGVIHVTLGSRPNLSRVTGTPVKR